MRASKHSGSGIGRGQWTCNKHGILCCRSGLAADASLERHEARDDQDRHDRAVMRDKLRRLYHSRECPTCGGNGRVYDET